MPGMPTDAPEPLPMPLQNILVSEAHQRMSESRDPDHRRDAGRARSSAG